MADEIVRIVNVPTEREHVQSLGESVLGFFSVRTLDDALNAADWAVKEEIRILASIAKNETADPGIRMAAMKTIREHLKESLVLNGSIKDYHAWQSGTLPNGQTVTAQITGNKLCLPNSQSLLETALATDQIVDAEPGDPNESGDSKPRRPERDLGGGGLCRSSQEEARRAREVAKLAAREAGLDLHGLPTVGSHETGGPSDPGDGEDGTEPDAPDLQ